MHIIAVINTWNVYQGHFKCYQKKCEHIFDTYWDNSLPAAVLLKVGCWTFPVLPFMSFSSWWKLKGKYKDVSFSVVHETVNT